MLGFSSLLDENLKSCLCMTFGVGGMFSPNMTQSLLILFQFGELPKVLAEECTFIFLRLNVLREYLEKELLMNGLPFPYEFEVNKILF